MSISNIMMMAVSVLPAAEAIRVSSKPAGKQYVAGAESLDEWARAFCDGFDRTACAAFFDEHLQALDAPIEDLVDPNSVKPIWQRLGKIRTTIFTIERNLNKILANELPLQGRTIAEYAMVRVLKLKALVDECEAAASPAHSTTFTKKLSLQNLRDYEETNARGDGEDTLSARKDLMKFLQVRMKEFQEWRQGNAAVLEELKQPRALRSTKGLKTVGSAEELQAFLRNKQNDTNMSKGLAIDSPTSVFGAFENPGARDHQRFMPIGSDF